MQTIVSKDAHSVYGKVDDSVCPLPTDSGILVSPIQFVPIMDQIGHLDYIMSPAPFEGGSLVSNLDEAPIDRSQWDIEAILKGVPTST